MNSSSRLGALLVCASLTAFGTAAIAQSAMEDATTKMDEAAEAEAMKAEAEAKAQAEKLMEQEMQGKEMTEEEVSGEE